MSEFKEITGIDNQPYFSFMHNNQEYFIWFWLSDGGPDVSKACLSIPVSNGSGGFVPNNVLAEFAFENRVNEFGGVKGFMNQLFLPKVNAYLLAQGGVEDNSFPVNGEGFEKFNWIVENALSYANGKVVMSDF